MLDVIYLRFWMDDSWTRSPEEVLKFFDVDESGLTDSQVQRNQERYGPNGTHGYAYAVCPMVCYVGITILSLFIIRGSMHTFFHVMNHSYCISTIMIVLFIFEVHNLI